MSFDLYAQSTPHHVSQHDLIIRSNQFTDVMCKKWRDATIFSKSFTVILLRFQEMTVILQRDFKRFQYYFFVLRQVCFLYYFKAALKRLAFNSSAIMCYVMKKRKIILWKYSILFHDIWWSQTLGLLNKWLHNYTIIMMYFCFHDRFESNHTE